jgi:hypothetical protein
MPRRAAGPRRSSSVEALLRGTRILAIAALLALAAAIALDVLEGDFWSRHTLLAGIVASVIVVMLSVAVIGGPTCAIPTTTLPSTFRHASEHARRRPRRASTNPHWWP